MALDATVGGANSTSYVTLIEANTYFASHWSTAKLDAWDSLESPNKEAVLKAATQVIEALRILDYEVGYGTMPAALRSMDEYSFSITRQLPNQRLAFPRNIDTTYLDLPFIPQEVKDAQCEQAVYMVSFDESVLATQLQGVTEEAVAVGGARIYQNFGVRGTVLAPLAFQLLAQFVRPTRRLRRS